MPGGAKRIRPIGVVIIVIICIVVMSAPEMRGSGIGRPVAAPAGWAVIDRRPVTGGTGITGRTIAPRRAGIAGRTGVARRTLISRRAARLLSGRMLLSGRPGGSHGWSLCRSAGSWVCLGRPDRVGLCRPDRTFLCRRDGAYHQKENDGVCHGTRFCYEWYYTGCGGWGKLRFFFSFRT